MCQGVIVINVLITVWLINIDRIANCTLGNRNRSTNFCPPWACALSFGNSEYCRAIKAGSGRSRKKVIKKEMLYMKLATTQGPVVNSLKERSPGIAAIQMFSLRQSRTGDDIERKKLR